MEVEEESKTFVDTIILKLNDLIFTPNSEQRMSSGSHVMLIGRGNEPCYTPEIVRIGLNHDYSRWCETMYEDKCRCLKSLLDRINETNVDRYVRAMDDLVERVRECYERPGDASRADSVEMILLDCCFIVELCRMYFEVDRRQGKYMNEPIFHKMSTDPNFLPALRRDLFRVGNQLPFSVLLKFLEITPGNQLPEITPGNQLPEINPGNQTDHLYGCALHFYQNIINSRKLFGMVLYLPKAKVQNLLELVYYTVIEPLSLNPQTYGMEFMELEFINYATQLQEAGVKFKKKEFFVTLESSENLFDINFKKNGVMEIPPLLVSDNTLYDLRNLMEFEKQLPIFVPRPLNDYVKFIQCLVNSPNDVKLLRRCGIIDNWLGNDEVIFKRLNELGSKAEILLSDFTYSELMENVNKHCKHRRNVWMATLWRNYLNSPWTFLSVLAAVVLLLLTVIQTVFSVLSYHHN